jgi:hypothetical protein
MVGVRLMARNRSTGLGVKKRMPKRSWSIAIPVTLVVVCLIVAVGLAVSGAIVRKEGFEGIWSRKKSWIKQAQPGLAPSVDRAERIVRDRASDGH